MRDERFELGFEDLSVSEVMSHSLKEISQRKGRKRKLEKELDELINQDKNVLDTGESPNEAMGSDLSAEDIVTSEVVPKSLKNKPPNPEHPEDKSKTTKGSTKGQLFILSLHTYVLKRGAYDRTKWTYGF